MFRALFSLALVASSSQVVITSSSNGGKPKKAEPRVIDVTIRGQLLDHNLEPYTSAAKLRASGTNGEFGYEYTREFRPAHDGAFEVKLSRTGFDHHETVHLQIAPDAGYGSTLAFPSPEAGARYDGQLTLQGAHEPDTFAIYAERAVLALAPEVARVTVTSEQGGSEAKIYVYPGATVMGYDTPDMNASVTVPIGDECKLYSWETSREWSVHGWSVDGPIELHAPHTTFFRGGQVTVKAAEIVEFECRVDRDIYPDAEFIAVFSESEHRSFPPLAESNPSYVRFRVAQGHILGRAVELKVRDDSTTRPFEFAGGDYVIELWGTSSFEEGVPLATTRITMPRYSEVVFE